MSPEYSVLSTSPPDQLDPERLPDQALDLAAHALDLRLGQAARPLDADRVLLAGAEVAGRHLQHPVDVQRQADLDLRDAARRPGDAPQVELAQQPVVGGHRALAL